jgi:hypothetical protein
MIDDELASAVEELRQRLLPVRPLEHVILRDGLPRQIAPLLAQLIAQAGEFLLLQQQLLARLGPSLARHDFVMLCHKKPRRGLRRRFRLDCPALVRFINRHRPQELRPGIVELHKTWRCEEWTVQAREVVRSDPAH